MSGRQMAIKNLLRATGLPYELVPLRKHVAVVLGGKQIAVMSRGCKPGADLKMPSIIRRRMEEMGVDWRGRV